MSVARSASATTSLPKPATLTPARTGRSSADKLPPPAGRAFAPSFVLLAKLLSPPFSARRADGRASNRIKRPVAKPAQPFFERGISTTYQFALWPKITDCHRIATERILVCTAAVLRHVLARQHLAESSFDHVSGPVIGVKQVTVNTQRDGWRAMPEAPGNGQHVNALRN